MRTSGVFHFWTVEPRLMRHDQRINIHEDFPPPRKAQRLDKSPKSSIDVTIIDTYPLSPNLGITAHVSVRQSLNKQTRLISTENPFWHRPPIQLDITRVQGNHDDEHVQPLK